MSEREREREGCRGGEGDIKILLVISNLFINFYMHIFDSMYFNGVIVK